MAKGAQHKKEEKEPVKEIAHLVFDQKGGACIEESFTMDPGSQGEIICLEENYALGPIAELEEPEGWMTRKQWWQVLLDIPEEEQPPHMTGDKMKLHGLKQRLEEDPNLQLWIWLGQNARDVCGYYWLISQLSVFQGQVHVLYLNNLPFIDDKGHIFYPIHLSEILPKEFVKAARLARVVTMSEFELDPDEWNKLALDGGYIRTLEGGKKLLSHPADFYDKIILDQLGQSTMKLQKLLGQLHSQAKLDAIEPYILWRIKTLIAQEQIAAQGDWDKGAKSLLLKATRGQLFVEINPDEPIQEVEPNEENA